MSVGNRAFLNECFQMTMLLLTPLLRANLTNSESSTSNIALRVSRRKLEEKSHPNVIDGRM